jgi:8-oxo-dGTP diphosphatase
MKKDMTAALIIRDGKLLLVHNTKHGGLRIEPPGGKKHGDEGWEESVVREAAEELGIDVRPLRLFGTYGTHSPEGEFSVRLYICEIISGEPRVMEPDKIPAFGWYSIEDMERLSDEGSLVPNMAGALDDIRRFLADKKPR